MHHNAKHQSNSLDFRLLMVTWHIEQVGVSNIWSVLEVSQAIREKSGGERESRNSDESATRANHYTMCFVLCALWTMCLRALCLITSTPCVLSNLCYVDFDFALCTSMCCWLQSRALMVLPSRQLQQWQSGDHWRVCYQGGKTPISLENFQIWYVQEVELFHFPSIFLSLSPLWTVS